MVIKNIGRRGRPHVVIVGSGFGGLFAAQALKAAKVDITLIARTDHHLFQPLLYQVATGILSSGEIAPATREILKRQRNVRVVLGDVTALDLEARCVHWSHDEHSERTPYDSLIVAAGASGSYFGHDEYADFAPGMKTIDDALELRARIFHAFEAAELASDEDERRRLLTFVVVGAGPTGVEMAGQLRELASRTLRDDFREADPTTARVVLVDGADQVLPTFGPRLGRKTQQALRKLGVEVRLGALVTSLDAHGVTLQRGPDSERVEAGTVIWSAGVTASPLGASLAEQTGAALDRAGRITPEPDLSLPDHPEVFVVGDMVAGYPGVAQNAIQGARHAAAIIAARALPAGEARDKAVASASRPYAYRDKGSMATIAKYAAVMKAGRFELTGFPAWAAWLFLHLLYIAGFKQRLSTLVRWGVSFASNARGNRTTTAQQRLARVRLLQRDGVDSK